MGINLFLVKSRSSTIQDLFLFVFTQDILHYLGLWYIIFIYDNLNSKEEF
ncbi:hypothetical protein SAG0170_05705 [Streptococcus agalactiae LDS 617]|nr:hypothetical protein SAG0170_05705 [Streptococcus agalactiae LDS 617]